MRIALGIEYDGAAYYGWQRQKDVISVQEKLEQALSIIANHPVSVTCAGRTDSGVHGTGQVVHFDTESERKDAAWTLGLNANLPDDIAIRWVKHVDPEFHARFSATARRYRYIIYNHPFRPGILNKGLSHYYVKLDAYFCVIHAQICPSKLAYLRVPMCRQVLVQGHQMFHRYTQELHSIQ